MEVSETARDTEKDGCSGLPVTNNQVNCNDEGGDNEPQLSKSKKRRLKKQRKKQRDEDSAGGSTRISWGPVTEFLFARQVGMDTVPKSGGYPLGLGELVESVVVPLDVHIANQQDVLRKRMQELDKNAAGLSITDQEMVFETRQWDFKRRINNPLFKPLREPARAELLEHLDIKQSVLNEQKHQFDKIKASRESTKCSCKPMKSLDKLSVTKLKQELTARGLSSAELESKPKTELMALLKERLRGEPLCNANNCECFRQGVECHFDICGCCHKASALQQCGNPNGKYEYDGRAVNIYRKRILFPDTWMELLAEDMPRTRPHADSVISLAESVLSLPDTEDGDAVKRKFSMDVLAGMDVAAVAEGALNGAHEKDDHARERTFSAVVPPQLDVESTTRIPLQTPSGVSANSPSSKDDGGSQSLTEQLLQLIRGDAPLQPENGQKASATANGEAGASAATKAPFEGHRCRPPGTARSDSNRRKPKAWKPKQSETVC